MNEATPPPRHGPTPRGIAPSALSRAPPLPKREEGLKCSRPKAASPRHREALPAAKKQTRSGRSCGKARRPRLPSLRWQPPDCELRKASSDWRRRRHSHKAQGQKRRGLSWRRDSLCALEFFAWRPRSTLRRIQGKAPRSLEIAEKNARLPALFSRKRDPVHPSQREGEVPRQKGSCTFLPKDFSNGKQRRTGSILYRKQQRAR